MRTTSRSAVSAKGADDLYRVFFENSNDGVIIFDREERVVSANQRIADMLHYSVEELIGCPRSQFIAPFELEDSYQKMQELWSGKTLPIRERTLLRKDGTQVVGELNAIVIRDETRQPSHILYITRDVTTRKQQEHQLRQSEALYRAVTNNFPNGAIVLFDHDLRFVLAEGLGLAEVGLSKEFLEGKTIWESFPAETAALIEPFYRAALAGEHKMLEVPYEDHIYATRFVPIRGAKGKVIYGLSITHDITDWKRIEEALRESETRFRSLVSAMSDVVFTLDVQLRHTGVYGRWLEEHGFTEEQFLGKTSREILGGEAGVHEEANERTLKGEQVTYEWSTELGGKTVHYQTSLSPVLDASDKVIGIVGVGRDISKIKRSQEQALALVLERERSRILAGFIQNASHEFRTPLSLIETSLYLLERSDDPQKIARYIGNIRGQSANILRLVEGLDALVRLDSAQELVLNKFSFREFLRGLAEQWTLESHNLHLDFRMMLPDCPLIIDAAPDELGLALIQVVGNALRYTPEGGSVLLNLEVHGEEIVLEVHDSGIGISDETLPHIFKRFFREDKAHSSRGFGLGLSIAQRVIELHHGRIEVQSAPGEGTTFTIYLPLYEKLA